MPLEPLERLIQVYLMHYNTASICVVYYLEFWFLIYYLEEFEDTRGVIRIRKSKKNGQHIGQEKKDKQRTTNHTHKAKDQVTRTPLTTWDKRRGSGKVSSYCSTSGTCRVNKPGGKS